MIETKELKFFVTCVETKSFRQATEELYTAQSSISKVIKGLESKLGYQLFLRSNHGIVVTERGKEFYKQAKQILEKIEDLEVISMKPGETQ